MASDFTRMVQTTNNETGEACDGHLGTKTQEFHPGVKDNPVEFIIMPTISVFYYKYLINMFIYVYASVVFVNKKINICS